MYGNIMSGEAEPKPVSQLKLAMKKIWDSLPQVQLTKLSRVLEIVWQNSFEYVKGDGWHSEHFSVHGADTQFQGEPL